MSASFSSWSNQQHHHYSSHQQPAVARGGAYRGDAISASASPPQLDADVLERHMGSVKRYYEQRIQQLEVELAKCRRTCNCHNHSHNEQRNDEDAERRRFSSPPRQVQSDPHAFTTAAPSSSIMISPISHRVAPHEHDDLLRPTTATGGFASTIERERRGTTSSPQRRAVGDTLAYDFQRLPPRHPSGLSTSPYRGAPDASQVSPSLAPGAAVGWGRQPPVPGSAHQSYTPLSPSPSVPSASDYFFALPAQDYFRATLQEVSDGQSGR